MNKVQKRSIGFYVSIVAAVVAVAAAVVYYLNGNNAYYHDFNTQIMLLSAVAVAIEIVHLVLTILMGEKRWLDILHIVPPVLLGYTMVGFLSARVASAGLILGSSLEAGNVTAHNALYQAFLGIGLYLAAIILSVARSFMAQVKEA